MWYRYLGNMRVQLWFYSPNACAAFLCMTIFLTLGLASWSRSRTRWKYRLLGWGALALAGGQMWLLAGTYSRGGYLAFFFTLGLLWYLSRKKLFPVTMLVFGIILLFINDGIKRVESMAVTSDGSISHRLLVWLGGTGMIAENPLRGIYPRGSGEVYTQWYQPLWLQERYNSLVSDYLSLAAIYGLPLFWLYLTTILLAFSLAVKRYRQTGSSLLLAVIGIITAYSLSAVFSTFYSLPSVSWLFYASLALLWGMIVFQLRRGTVLLTRRDWTVPAAAAVFCAVLLFCGLAVNHCLPYRHGELHAPELPGIMVMATPKKITRPIHILYLVCTEDGNITGAIRDTVRPLAERGFAVYGTAVDAGLDGPAQTAKIIAYCRKIIGLAPALFLVGQGDAGKLALIAAAGAEKGKLQGVVAIGSPAEWPFRELSPLEHLSTLKIPLLLIHGERDATNAFTESLRLKTFCDQLHIPVDCRIIKGAEAHLTPSRDQAFNLLADFTAKVRTAEEAAEPDRLLLQVFFKPGCEHCRAYEVVLDRIAVADGDRIRIERHDVTTAEGRVFYAAYSRCYGIEHAALVTPRVFFSDRFLSGETAIRDTEAMLQTVLTGHHPTTIVPSSEDLRRAERRIMAQWEKAPLFTILVAGLIDGINPCVFSTLVFFMSLLTVMKIKNQLLLAVGGIYCLSCYISYFLMGLGILSLFNIVNRFQLLGRALNYCMVGVLAVLAVLSFRDAYRYRKTKNTEAITLQLPGYLKRLIHSLMRRALQYRYLLPGVFLVGFSVTLIESACSGQVYIPVIGMISRSNSFSAAAIAYLAFYNLMCIIPVVTVLLLTYYGTTTMALINWAKKDVVVGKLLMGCLFAGLALILLYL